MAFYKPLKDYVLEYISDQINTGALKPKEKISENSICEALELSRTPVREAFIQLENEGILEKLPRKGFIVKQVDWKKVKEIYFIIGTLEGAAASLSVLNINDSELSLMNELLDEMDKCINEEDFKNYYKAQLKFHEVFINPCGNSEMIQLIQSLKSKFIRRSYVLNEQDKNLKSALLETNKEHKQIYEFFVKKDGASANQYLRDVHWNTTYAEYDSIV